MATAVGEAVGIARRFKVKFPSGASLAAALAAEAANLDIPVVSHKRSYLAIATPPGLAGTKVGEAILDNELEAMHHEFGGEVVVDYHYDIDLIEDDPLDLPPFALTEKGAEPDDAPSTRSLDDVLAQVRAREAWEESRGDDVVIAVVDTGVDGTRREFPAWKRFGHWEVDGDTPWTDWQGHGTMCAAIAGATRQSGGKFEGVAPGCKLIACKTRFYDSELVAIYDFLTGLKESDPSVRLVASNSFGVRSGFPPDPPPDADLLDALLDAHAAGIPIFFSAGNNHERAGGGPQDCHPNSVWLHKSRSEFSVVGACDLDGQLWWYSSRGPGQFFGQPQTSRKPDCVAPTPRNGRVPYGASDRTLPDGWGTSGACPQAAGLAALLMAKEPALTPGQVYEAIRRGSAGLGYTPSCEGSGRIDCISSLALI